MKLSIVGLLLLSTLASAQDGPYQEPPVPLQSRLTALLSETAALEGALTGKKLSAKAATELKAHLGAVRDELVKLVTIAPKWVHPNGESKGHEREVQREKDLATIKQLSWDLQQTAERERQCTQERQKDLMRMTAMQQQLQQFEVQLHRPPPPPPPPPPGPMAIAPADFARIVQGIDKQSFADAKIDVLKTAMGSNLFTVAQVALLVDKLTFSENKLEVVRLLNPRILDRNHVFELYEHFTFDSDKTALKQILDARP